MRRVEEIEAARAPSYLAQLAPSQDVGLPAQGKGYEKTEYDPKGIMNKKPGKEYNGNTDGGRLLEQHSKMREFARDANPYLAAIGRGYLKPVDARTRGDAGKSKDLYSGERSGAPQIMPNAAPIKTGAAPIGMTESGMPIYADADAGVPAPKGRTIIKIAPGAAAGINERGQSVGARGKNLGYLGQPALVTPRGDAPMRTGQRGFGDIVMSKDKGLASPDAFGASGLQQMYGKHAQAMVDNRDANGMPTDQFPAGHFQGMAPEEIENITRGVKALRAIDPKYGAVGTPM